MHCRAAFLLLLQFGLFGCAAEDDAQRKNRQKVEKLETDSVALAERVEAVETRLSSVEFRTDLLENSGQAYSNGTFDPAEKGYSRIDTTNGTFLVSIQNVTPYLDGFKVTCNFGNPSAATYNGFKLKAKWGPRFDREVKGANYTTWQSSLREKEISLTNQLRAGAWNPVSFVVSPAKADEFGVLELSMETNSISLTK